jgi:hypothetical protein
MFIKSNKNQQHEQNQQQQTEQREGHQTKNFIKEQDFNDKYIGKFKFTQ